MTGRPTKQRLRLTLLAGAGFLLLQLGWILSIAPHFGIDEFDHALRSSSVAAGHWQPGDDPAPADLGRGDLIPVRADVARSVRGACEARPYTKVYNCVPAQKLGNGEVLIASGAARYNPAFYAVVGTAASPFHGTANLYAMRVVVALMGCALLMLTVWLAAARARTVWPVVTVLLGALPTTTYSASIATPNGVEMIAGIGAWVALLAVTDPGTDPALRRSSYVLLGVFAAALVDLHTLGALWLGLITVAIAILHGPVRTARRLWPTDRVERTVAGLAVCAVAFEATWVLLAGTNDPSAEGTSFPQSPWGPLLNSLLLWPLQAIGAFPMRNDAAPPVVYALLLLVLGTVAVLALRRTPLRSRSTGALVFVAAASFAVPALMTLMSFHQLGVAWQGRYGMPFTVGLLVLAGRVLDRSERRVRRPRALATAAVAVLALTQLLSQWSVMTTQRGDADLVSSTGWVPPGPALLLSLGVLAGLCWIQVFKVAAVGATTAIGAHRPLQEATA